MRTKLFVSDPLSADLFETGQAIKAAGDLSPTGSPDEKKENLIEPHMSAAAQVVPVWNWLANAKEKFIKAGKPAKDLTEAIENYEKLYRSAAKGKDYIEWLLQWFF